MKSSSIGRQGSALNMELANFSTQRYNDTIASPLSEAPVSRTNTMNNHSSMVDALRQEIKQLRQELRHSTALRGEGSGTTYGDENDIGRLYNDEIKRGKALEGRLHEVMTEKVVIEQDLRNQRERVASAEFEVTRFIEKAECTYAQYETLKKEFENLSSRYRSEVHHLKSGLEAVKHDVQRGMVKTNNAVAELQNKAVEGLKMAGHLESVVGGGADGNQKVDSLERNAILELKTRITTNDVAVRELEKQLKQLGSQ